MLDAKITSLSQLEEDHDPSFKFTIITEESELYPVPKSVCHEEDQHVPSETLQKQFISPREVKTPAKSLTFLENCFVLPNAAMVTEKGNIIAESCLPYTQPWIGEVFKPWITAAGSEYKVGTEGAYEEKNLTFYMREHGEDGFFHWVHSVLPRLEPLKKHQFCSEIKLLCRANSPFQKASLELAGAGKFERLAPALDRPQFFRKLIFPSALVENGDFWLRPLSVNRFYDRLTVSPPNKIRSGKIYVSRGDAAVRRLANEHALLERLAKLGFEAVELGSLEFEQQVSLFRNSQVVMSCHGAGLSHIVSMRPGTKIIEILHPRRFWPTYRAIAARSKVEYGFVLGDDPGDQVKGDEFDYNVNVDKTIDVLTRLVQGT